MDRPLSIETANGTLRLFQDVEVIGGPHKGLRGVVAMFGKDALAGMVYVEDPEDAITVVEAVNVSPARLGHCTGTFSGHSPLCDRDGTYCSQASSHAGPCTPHGGPR